MKNDKTSEVKNAPFLKRALNRLQRRSFKNRAQTEGKSKKYYTTKQTKTRKKKNGKKVTVRKNKGE